MIDGVDTQGVEAARSFTSTSRYGRARDLTGLVSGKLTALRRTERVVGSQCIWEARCECGALIELRSGYLTSGQQKSCGCSSIRQRVCIVCARTFESSRANANRCSLECHRERDKLQQRLKRKDLDFLIKTRAKEHIWRCANAARVMLTSAKWRAQKKGVPFTISRDDIVVPQFCPVLGIPITPRRPEHYKNKTARTPDGAPTLDKLIPELGYTPGNVYIISHRANRIKSDATLAEIEAIAAYMRANIR